MCGVSCWWTATICKLRQTARNDDGKVTPRLISTCHLFISKVWRVGWAQFQSIAAACNLPWRLMARPSSSGSIHDSRFFDFSRKQNPKLVRSMGMLLQVWSIWQRLLITNAFSSWWWLVPG